MSTIDLSLFSKKRKFNMDSQYALQNEETAGNQNEAGSLLTEGCGSESSLSSEDEERKSTKKMKSPKKMKSSPSPSCIDSFLDNLKEPTSLPDPAIDVSPNVFLLDLLEALYGSKFEVKPAFQLNKYFTEITEERMAAYDVAAVTATRTNNLADLKQLYTDGKRMDCCNRFGESLLHMACRRGFVDIGIFLLSDADLTVRITDDCGRNPFHDICWNPKIEVKLALEILTRDPTLLLIGDKRGHTPFDYARRQDWRTWRDILLDNHHLLEPLRRPENRAIFESTKDGQ